MEGFLTKPMPVNEDRDLHCHAFGAAPLEFRIPISILCCSALGLSSLQCVVNPTHAVTPDSGGQVAVSKVNSGRGYVEPDKSVVRAQKATNAAKRA